MDNLQATHERHWKGKDLNCRDNFERNKLIKAFFKDINKDAKILDLACGNGDVTEFLAGSGFRNVYSVDFSAEGVEMTRKRGGQNILQADICTPLPYEENFFDYILWLDNIEHLVSPQSALDNIKRSLKKEGSLLLSVPNMGYWFYRLYYLKTGNVIGTDGELPDGHINLPWEYQHIRFFNEKYIKMFLEKDGFKIGKITGFSNRGKYLNSICNIYRRLLADGFLIVAKK